MNGVGHLRFVFMASVDANDAGARAAHGIEQSFYYFEADAEALEVGSVFCARATCTAA